MSVIEAPTVSFTCVSGRITSANLRAVASCASASNTNSTTEEKLASTLKLWEEGNTIRKEMG